MSSRATHWALQQKTAQPVDKLILIALGDFCDDNNSCYPSRKRLAKIAMCSIDTVDRAIKRLTADGLVEKADRVSEKGGFTSNRYILNVDADEAADHKQLRKPSRKMRLGGTAAKCPHPKPQSAATLAASGAATLAAQAAATYEPSIEPSLEPASQKLASLKAAFNGSTENLLVDIQRWMGGSADRENAVNWLTTQLSIAGQDAVLSAYGQIQASQVKGRLIADPIRYLSTTARALKAQAKPEAAPAVKVTTATYVKPAPEPEYDGRWAKEAAHV